MKLANCSQWVGSLEKYANTRTKTTDAIIALKCVLNIVVLVLLLLFPSSAQNI